MPTYAPFNPHEPRPALPPTIAPGVLIAAYDAAGVRLTTWQPADRHLSATWTLPGDVAEWAPAFVVAWDGGERHAALPLYGSPVVRHTTGSRYDGGDHLTVHLPPTDRAPAGRYGNQGGTG